MTSDGKIFLEVSMIENLIKEIFSRSEIRD